MGNRFSFYLTDYHETVDPPIVETRYGQFLGKSFKFHHGKKINAFLGVPFASVGIGEKRFQKPFPPEKFVGIKDCRKFGPRAIQGDLWWDRIITNTPQSEEKCLNMCIFTPAWESDEFPNGRPVMVFLHGGGYLVHSASNYGDVNICRNICLHDVIVCTIQYRLGLLGFLSSGDADCRGNFGLWDQVAAFQWIRENIAAFGGDPTNVTGFGQSAGGASLDFLSISPHNDDWFDRIILMGGNGCGDWAITEPALTQRGAVKLLRKNGVNDSFQCVADLVACCRRQPVAHLAPNLVGKSAFNRDKNGLEFCPVIDGDLLPHPTAVLRQSTRKISVIIGTADCEALLFHALGRSQSDLRTIKKFLEINIGEICRDFETLREEARQLYLRNVDLNDKEQVSRAFINLYSDVFMNNATQKYVEQMVEAGHDVYRYNMTYYNPDSFGFFAYRMPFLAATHCHDLRYVFGKGLYAKFRPNCDDIHMLDIMTTLWTNYAKYGNPNGRSTESESANGTFVSTTNDSNGNSIVAETWHKVNTSDLYSYMELSLTPTMKTDYQGRRYEFWKRVEANRPKPAHVALK